LAFISGEAIILGFQHYILALGTAVMIPAVLVPMMGGDDVSSCVMPSAFWPHQIRAGSWQHQFGDVIFWVLSLSLVIGVAICRETGSGWCRRCSS